MRLSPRAPWKFGLWIKVDRLHVLRNNSVQKVPAVGLVIIPQTIAREGDHQLLHAVLVYVHRDHLSGICVIPRLPPSFLAPGPKPIGRTKITGDAVVQSNHVLRDDRVDRRLLPD